MASDFKDGTARVKLVVEEFHDGKWHRESSDVLTFVRRGKGQRQDIMDYLHALRSVSLNEDGNYHLAAVPDVKSKGKGKKGQRVPQP